MQIALQDIRTLGYKKIIKYYLNTDKREKFFEDLQSINILYYTMKIPAYSLLNKWSLLEVDDSLRESIRGYSSFIYSLEPMIDLEAPSDSSKRKCRNTWDSVWNTFGSISKLEGYQVTLLKDFGLKVLFIYFNCVSYNDELNKLCCNTRIKDERLLCVLEYMLNFYNVVLTWALFSQQESNFTKNNFSFIGVINMLVVNDEVEFEKELRMLY